MQPLRLHLCGQLVARAGEDLARGAYVFVSLYATRTSLADMCVRP